MIVSRTNVLRNKKGFATVFMLGAMAVIVMFAVGVVIVNYSLMTVTVSQTQNLTSAVQSRVESYVADLNGSPTSIPVTPSLAAVADIRTGLTTKIVSATPSSDGLSQVLIVDSASADRSFQITRSVTILSTPVTHISGFDSQGNPIWTLTDEPNVFGLWSVSEGSVRVLNTTELNAERKNATAWDWASDRLGIDSNGHLWAWGANNVGQAGIGTVSATAVPEPVALTLTRKYKAAASDGTSSFAIDTTGQLWAWGDNTSGKLGNGTTTNSSTPVAIATGTLFLAVTTSGNSTFALDKDGKIYAWGADSGRLGTGTSSATQTAPKLINSTASFQSVVTSGGSTFAIRSDDTPVVWGVNAAGELGTGAASAVVKTPTVMSATLKLSDIAAGNKSFAAIDTSGSVWTWGKGGQNGDGTMNARLSPYKIPGAATFSNVAVGQGTTYAIDSYSRLYVWGSNAQGQYGVGTTTTSLSPTAALSGVAFRELWADESAKDAVGLDRSGGLWSFGHTGTGAWTTAYTTDVNSAVKMPIPAGFIAAGWN